MRQHLRRLAKLELRLLPRGMRGLALIEARVDAALSPRERDLLAEVEAWTEVPGPLSADHQAALEKRDALFYSVFDALKISERPTLAEFDAVMADAGL